jgi:hypothetical protein
LSYLTASTDIDILKPSTPHGYAVDWGSRKSSPRASDERARVGPAPAGTIARFRLGLWLDPELPEIGRHDGTLRGSREPVLLPPAFRLLPSELVRPADQHGADREPRAD